MPDKVMEPELIDNEVLLTIKAMGKCGRDVHSMDGSTGRRMTPIIMGHEASVSSGKLQLLPN